VEQDLYRRQPLELTNDIPVFSPTTEYTENYEKISGDHLQSIGEDGDNPFIPEALWVETEQSTEELIRQHAKPGDKILDVGVGLGRLLSRFPDMQRYGMDISFGYLAVAQREGIEVCYSLIEDMPYQSGLFDIVVVTDVLEHVLDLNLCCRKILDVLKSGGILIVRVPYREDLSGYLAPEYPYKYVHLRTFDEHFLHLHFDRVFGCKVLETRTAGYLPYSSHLRCPLRFPARDRILMCWLGTIRRCFGARAYQAEVRRLYRPAEINAVVRKP
jgi:SAM-dependent methyltransferase